MEKSQVQDLVRDLLSERYGQSYTEEGGRFFLSFEDGCVVLILPEIYQDEPIVEIVAVVASEVPADPELYAYLIAESGRIVYGKFLYIEENGLVTCNHALAARSLTSENLAVAVETVGGASIAYGQIITEHFGGRLAGEN